MEWRVFCIEVLAILASYLIITLPAASATRVNICHMNKGNVVDYVIHRPWLMIEKDISVNPPWGSPTVSIRVSNSSGAVLEEVLLYRCRGMNPADCMSSVQPESSPGGLVSDFSWGSLAGQTVSYPQRARLLVMARMNNAGRVFWTGFWTGIERRSEQSFEVVDDEIGSISLVVDSIESINLVKNFLESSHMIPVRSDWISRVVFDGAGLVYSLAFDEPGDAEGEELSGNEVVSVSKNYTFILPSVSSRIRNPILLYKNPPYVCGDGRCEDGTGGTEDRGENSGNCCLDCGCADGYYCDSSSGCRRESDIGLALFGSVPSEVENCFEDHELEVNVEFKSPPSTMSLSSAWYWLRNDRYETACTHLSGNIYTCPVTVPAMPGVCTGESFVLGPNRMGIEISFMDGSQARGLELGTGLPDITVGSFDCGDGNCETNLGEGWDNCCYDCPCPAGYCDYAGAADNASCRPDPQAGDIYAAAIEPDHFPVLSDGRAAVEMNVFIGNAPGSLDAGVSSCEAGCLKGDLVEACSANCNVDGCSVQPSSEPDKYNMSCTLSLDIADYDVGYSYSLSPGMSLGLVYSNGSSQVSRSVNKTFRNIGVGAQRCGDRDCTGNENAANCCYDCPCPAGQYCDTRNIDGPTTGTADEAGDMCKPLSGTELSMEDVDEIPLEDSTQPHTVTIRGSVPDPASGFAVSGVCRIANDPDIGCAMYCQRGAITESGQEIVCEMNVPFIDYLTTGEPYYDSGERVLRLQPNSYNITVIYNDGPARRERLYGESLGTIEITVTSHCGEGGCEDWLGETQDNCCRDCTCSGYGDDYFCFQGANPNGRCVRNDSILLEMVGFEPYPLGCEIGYIGGSCEFGRIHANVSVINAPPDLEIMEAYYVLEGQEPERCKCVPGAEHGNFTCPLMFGELEGTEGTETRRVNISLSLNYTLGGTEVTQEVNASREEEFTREKSEALESCESTIQNLEGQIGDLGSRADKYERWAKTLKSLALALFGMFIICMIASLGSGGTEPVHGWPVSGVEPSQPPGGPSVRLAGEGGTLGFSGGAGCAMFLMMAMSALTLAMTCEMQSDSSGMQKLQLERQLESKRQMCSSGGFSGFSSAVNGMTRITV
jgi:hypothetical protein